MKTKDHASSFSPNTDAGTACNWYVSLCDFASLREKITRAYPPKTQAGSLCYNASVFHPQAFVTRLPTNAFPSHIPSGCLCDNVPRVHLRLIKKSGAPALARKTGDIQKFWIVFSGTCCLSGFRSHQQSADRSGPESTVYPLFNFFFHIFLRKPLFHIDLCDKFVKFVLQLSVNFSLSYHPLFSTIQCT